MLLYTGIACSHFVVLLVRSVGSGRHFHSADVVHSRREAGHVSQISYHHIGHVPVPFRSSDILLAPSSTHSPAAVRNHKRTSMRLCGVEREGGGTVSILE